MWGGRSCPPNDTSALSTETLSHCAVRDRHAATRRSRRLVELCVGHRSRAAQTESLIFQDTPPDQNQPTSGQNAVGNLPYGLNISCGNQPSLREGFLPRLQLHAGPSPGPYQPVDQCRDRRTHLLTLRCLHPGPIAKCKKKPMTLFSILLGG